MSIEWLGLSHAKLSGYAGLGGDGRGGPLPGKGEPRPRVVRAEPGGGGSGGAALGIRAEGGRRVPTDAEGLWVAFITTAELQDPHDSQGTHQCSSRLCCFMRRGPEAQTQGKSC